MPISRILGSIFDTIKPFLVDGLGHVFCLNDRVYALKESMDSLNAIRYDMLRRIELGERVMRVPTSEAENWLQQVSTIDSEVESIEQKHGGKMQCLGCFYLNCWSSFQIGNKAVQQLHRVQELKTEASSFTVVTMAVPPPPVQELPTASMVSGDSTQSTLDMVLDYLGDDETSEEIVGIWGPGGIGKTTLLKKINNSLVADTRFHHVLLVVASKGCTAQKIQDSIVRQLKLRIDEDVGVQADTIFHFLCDKNFLLLLDDVWESVDLVGVGIPHPLGSSNGFRRKVILTTRSEALCGVMQAHKRIRMRFLNHKDAQTLFLKNVGGPTLNCDPSIPRLAEAVLAECGGLPLALVTIGKVMSSKRTPEEWEYAIGQLQNAQLLEGTDENLFSKLKLSFDFLREDRHRECFLHCALWPEDFNIKKEDIINCWIGHGLLDNSSDIFLKGYSVIGDLQASSLLESGDGDDKVKMHDVIRDMALWIASLRGDKWIVHAGVGLREAPGGGYDWPGALKVSLAYNKINSLPSCFGRDSKNLSTLMLQSNGLHFSPDLPSWAHYTFLKYLDLSRNTCSESDIFLNVFECMKNLEYLNLSDLGITIHMDGLGTFQKLKYLLLKNNNVTAKRALSAPPRLSALDVSNFYHRNEHGNIIACLFQPWHFENKLHYLGINVQSVNELQLVQALNIRYLAIQGMEGHSSLNLADPDIFGNSCFSLSLNELCISYCHDDLVQLLVAAESYTCMFANVKRLVFSYLFSLEEIIFERLAPADFFPRLREITLSHCDELSHVSWVLFLPCLEMLSLSACYNMKYVILDSQINTEARGRDTFPTLKRLILYRLPALLGVYDDALIALPFLENFSVEGCSNLQTFPFRVPPSTDGASSSRVGFSKEKHARTGRLELISGEQEWWDGLIWHDDATRAYFQQFFLSTTN